MMRMVVGVDGSAPSLRALRWAFEEARLRGATLHVVHAYRPASRGHARTPVMTGVREASLVGSVAVASTDDQVDDSSPAHQEDARLGTAVRMLLGSGTERGTVDVTTEAVASDRPAQVLIQRSCDAELLVVGSRGRSGLTGLLLGSVSQQCLTHAQSPVAVVR